MPYYVHIHTYHIHKLLESLGYMGGIQHLAHRRCTVNIDLVPSLHLNFKAAKTGERVCSFKCKFREGVAEQATHLLIASKY